MGVYSVLSRNLENIKQLSLADPGKIPSNPTPPPYFKTKLRP